MNAAAKIGTPMSGYQRMSGSVPRGRLRLPIRMIGANVSAQYSSRLAESRSWAPFATRSPRIRAWVTSPTRGSNAAVTYSATVSARRITVGIAKSAAGNGGRAARGAAAGAVGAGGAASGDVTIRPGLPSSLVQHGLVDLLQLGRDRPPI